MNEPGAAKLRRGWTTGACAAASARAAYEAILTGRFPDPVEIRLPRGERPRFALALGELTDGGARAGIVKDAGDDPDVTHGALVIAALAPAPPASGVSFHAGPGVGTVTRPGLPLAVGEPAINPGPRAMIHAALAEARRAAGEAAAEPDLRITITIPGGEALALRTLNGRLGIIGGLSVLGTTGVVVPYSCSAWIHSIHRGIDVARAMGLGLLAATTGSVSEAAVQRLHGLPEAALIDMGDFAGGTLKYLRRHPVARLILGGGFGKLAKLAQGHGDLHSARSRVDIAGLAALLAAAGAEPRIVAAAQETAGANEVLAIAVAAGEPLAAALTAAVAQAARHEAERLVDGKVAIEVLIFDRSGKLIGQAA